MTLKPRECYCGAAKTGYCTTAGGGCGCPCHTQQSKDWREAAILKWECDAPNSKICNCPTPEEVKSFIEKTLAAHTEEIVREERARILAIADKLKADASLVNAALKEIRALINNPSQK